MSAETLSTKLGLPPSGVCRFCGCTNECACVMPGATLGRCSWLDVRFSCCTAPDCARRAGELQGAALKARESGLCVCGGRKKQDRVFCWNCWGELPWCYQGYLFNDIAGAALGLYYHDALNYLRQRTGRLKPIVRIEEGR
jgi:hypothetical protein